MKNHFKLSKSCGTRVFNWANVNFMFMFNCQSSLMFLPFSASCQLINWMIFHIRNRSFSPPSVGRLSSSFVPCSPCFPMLGDAKTLLIHYWLKRKSAEICVNRLLINLVNEKWTNEKLTTNALCRFWAVFELISLDVMGLLSQFICKLELDFFDLFPWKPIKLLHWNASWNVRTSLGVHRAVHTSFDRS